MSNNATCFLLAYPNFCIYSMIAFIRSEEILVSSLRSSFEEIVEGDRVLARTEELVHRKRTGHTVKSAEIAGCGFDAA